MTSWNWKDRAGQRFGRLTAIEYTGDRRWRCLCDCGNIVTPFTVNLVNGNTTSCGCTRVQHGRSSTHLYGVWKSMHQRCGNPNDWAYANYGGRGITVCERWNDFTAFASDMGDRPIGFDLGRIDNDGPYSPKNCRWESRKANLSNRRNNHVVEWRGTSLPLTAWAERLGVNPTTLFTRLAKGWTIERTLATPVIPRSSRKD